MKTSMASMLGTRTTATDVSFTWPTARASTRRSPGIDRRTRQRPPGDYTSAGLPWFDFYDDSKALPAPTH